jgi:chaperonin GroES
MRIVPVNKQIILQIPKIEDREMGGIIIPAAVQEKPYQGIVYLSDHEDYKVGDVVLYRKYSGFEFNIEGEDYLVIEATDVLVKLEDIDTTKKPELIIKGAN